MALITDTGPRAGNAAILQPSRLGWRDLLRVGSIGIRTRRLRAALSGLGIAIGIAAMVAVLGISDSSRADLLSTLDRLGTNLLAIQSNTGFRGAANDLPNSAQAMVGRIAPVQVVSSVTNLSATVRRSDVVPSEQTGGITVKAADPKLLSTLGGTVASGRFLDATTARYPAVVLGAVAAQRLGVAAPGTRVWLGGQWFQVEGILNPIELAKDIDRSAIIGAPVAQQLFGTKTAADVLYVRADPANIDTVRAVIPSTANPESPDQVQVSRPSDALAARAAASSAFTSLFLGLGAVALLVGGVGIANVMVISVLERRSEVGLRRALGATRRHVSVQFLTEALFLSLFGGVAGVAIGSGVTAVYDLTRGWSIVIPPTVLIGGVAAALVIGAVAGLYPAMRAARLSPTEALRTV
ncbi:MAG: ABC transporter permease [Actinomycetota bacterium]|nr:ABC transporter permease [Actinomycetota bacterium]